MQKILEIKKAISIIKSQGSDIDRDNLTKNGKSMGIGEMIEQNEEIYSNQKWYQDEICVYFYCIDCGF